MSHTPHHLRYGDVETAGYAPGEDVTHARAVDERLDSHARTYHAERRYLFRKPRALQYFRGDVLVRSEEERSSGRLELFFDLVFVGLIAVLAEECVAQPTGASLVRYIVTYFPAYLVWALMREIFNNFFHDDLSQRLLVLVVMIFLVVYGNNAPHVQFSVHDEDDKYARATAVGSFLLSEFVLFATMIYYSFFVCQFRIQIRANVMFWLPAVGLWIATIFVSLRVAIALAVVAMTIEYVSWLFCYCPIFKRLAKLYYSSAVAIEHEIERFGDFVTLVHGEFLYSVISGTPAGTGVHGAVAKTAFTVAIAFAFHGMYNEGAGSRKITHPIRHSAQRAMLWFTAHLPLVSSITLCGDSTAELIQDNEVEAGLRWMFAGSYAVGMMSLYGLALLEYERDQPKEIWIGKHLRLIMRPIAALVVVLLPLAHQENVNSTALLGIACSLSMTAYLWQVIASLDGPNATWRLSHAESCNIDAWKGYPTLAEPSFLKMDLRRQTVPEQSTETVGSREEGITNNENEENSNISNNISENDSK